MAETKTKKTTESVETFLNSIKEENQRKDAFIITEMMKKASKSEPKMWGTAIIGFGEHFYKTADGKKHDWFMIGFSPRSKKLSFYLFGEKSDRYNKLREKLGKHKNSVGCLHVNKLADVDTGILKELFEMQIKVCSGK